MLYASIAEMHVTYPRTRPNELRHVYVCQRCPVQCGECLADPHAHPCQAEVNFQPAHDQIGCIRGWERTPLPREFITTGA